MWLKEAKGVFFSSLSSEETHKEFAKFVEVWNAGRLTPKYYQGIKSAPRTAHKWGIKLNHDEALALGVCLNYCHVPYLWPCKRVWLNSRHVYSFSDKLHLSFSAFWRAEVSSLSSWLVSYWIWDLCNIIVGFALDSTQLDFDHMSGEEVLNT